MMTNIFKSIPDDIHQEIVSDLLHNRSVRIERILSQGQCSPPQGWYDQDEHEWVLVVKGSAIIVFEQGKAVALSDGDYLHIPAHRKHRVQWTDPEQVTLWLAVFYHSC